MRGIMRKVRLAYISSMLMSLSMSSSIMSWELAEDSDSSAAEIADAELAYGWMENGKMVQMAFGSHYMLALYKMHKKWMLAQWMSLPEETKDAWMEKHDMDKEDHDMDEDDMYTLFGF
jgi:hypothetical protein